MMPGMPTTPARALDHLLIGAPTLEQGIAWLEERTGVRAAPGGSHPGLGTWNALASLGPAQYIEVIAPDPSQPGVATFYAPRLRDLREPRIVTWAARASFICHCQSTFSLFFLSTMSRDLLFPLVFFFSIKQNTLYFFLPLFRLIELH